MSDEQEISHPFGQPGDCYGHWTAFAQARDSAIKQSYFNALATQQIAAQNYAAVARQAFASPPACAVADAGISAGEIVAHRCWRHVGCGWLQSIAVETIWPITEPMTGEVAHNGVSGIHAFKSERRALDSYALSATRAHPLVFGTVALWGTVIEHEHGWRAEFGKILSVDVITGVRWWRERSLLRRIRDRYRLVAWR